MGAAHACRDTGHTCGAVSDSVGLVFDFVYSVACNSLADDAECVGFRSPWCAVTVVDGYVATLRGHVDDHLTVPSDGRASWFNHVSGKNQVAMAASTALPPLLRMSTADLCGDGGERWLLRRSLDNDFVFVGSPDAMGVHEFKSPTNAI